MLPHITKSGIDHILGIQIYVKKRGWMDRFDLTIIQKNAIKIFVLESTTIIHQCKDAFHQSVSLSVSESRFVCPPTF